MRGTMTWFDAQRGYGYIQREDGKSILVRQSDLRETGDTPLYDGDDVEFEVRRDTRGYLKAVNVHRG